MVSYSERVEDSEGFFLVYETMHVRLRCGRHDRIGMRESNETRYLQPFYSKVDMIHLIRQRFIQSIDLRSF